MHVEQSRQRKCNDNNKYRQTRPDQEKKKKKWEKNASNQTPKRKRYWEQWQYPLCHYILYLPYSLLSERNFCIVCAWVDVYSRRNATLMHRTWNGKHCRLTVEIEVNTWKSNERGFNEKSTGKSKRATISREKNLIPNKCCRIVSGESERERELYIWKQFNIIMIEIRAKQKKHISSCWIVWCAK